VAWKCPLKCNFPTRLKVLFGAIAGLSIAMLSKNYLKLDTQREANSYSARVSGPLINFN